MISDFIKNRSFPVNWKLNVKKCEHSQRSLIHQWKRKCTKIVLHTTHKVKELNVWWWWHSAKQIRKFHYISLKNNEQIYKINANMVRRRASCCRSNPTCFLLCMCIEIVFERFLLLFSNTHTHKDTVKWRCKWRCTTQRDCIFHLFLRMVPRW